MSNIIRFNQKENKMNIQKDTDGTEYLYIKGVVSKGVMHRANITPEVKEKLDDVKQLIKKRMNK
tara:strand:+ start:219 stop:410 length:192 start_codon:yes stop_codon:yes gene_type:complete